MDIEQVREGIVTTVLAVITTELTALPYAVNSGQPDLFYVSRAIPIFDATMGRATDQFTITCRILVDGVDETSAQRRLDAYLKGSGPRSLKAALQSDRTFAGSVTASRVEGFEGYGKAPLGSNEYWASELNIFVSGPGD